MGTITYRANLSAKSIPLLSESFGRSVIVPDKDQNFNRQVTATEDSDKDIGIPQVYYCHNVMPTAQGLQSVGYDPVTPAVPDELGFKSIYIIRDASENKAYFAHTDEGFNYVQEVGETTWKKINDVAATGLVSVAFVSGVTYIYFEKVGCYKYDFTTELLVAVPLTGVTAANLIGVTGAAGYLITWTETEIAWSSTIDPTDFVPSIVTGAGGGQVEGAKGKLTIIVTNFLGVIIYTTNNAVAAVYSGNSRYPFNFREIIGAGGVANLELVAATTGNQYAYTTSGLQIVSSQNSQTVFPEITDFVAGEYFEDFDEDTLTFSTQITVAPMKKKLTVVSDRYMIMSYGVDSLTHAIVYDIAQKRFGKLKFPHVDCFELELLAPEVVETPRKSIGFLQADGTIKSVNFSVTSQFSSGVALCGKYQFIRSRLLTLESIMLENVRAGANFNLYDFYTLDGKNDIRARATLKTNRNLYREYNIHKTGVNHSLLFTGAFYLVSLVLEFHVNGRR